MSGDEREQVKGLVTIRFALVMGVIMFALVTFGLRYTGNMKHEDLSVQNLTLLRYGLWAASAFAVGWAFYWKARMESARSMEEVRRALILGWAPGEAAALLGGVIYFNGGPHLDFVFGFVAFVVVLALLRIPTASPLMRVVSLLPSATEIVAALGGMEHLVGVTHACDHPPMVDSRVRVTRTAVNAHAAPGVVDAQVREITHEGQPLYTLLEDRIRALQPDLILTQALCEVCAVMETDVRSLASRLAPTPRVVSLSASSLDGVLADIAAVAAAMGLDDESDELLGGARERLRAVHDVLARAKVPRPRVAVIEWGDPLYAAGHWVPEMVARAGGVDVLAKPGEHSVVVRLEQVRAADPEVILIAPCGYDLGRSAEEGARLLALDEWAWARDRRVVALDANAFASRPGPRLVDGIEVMARVFHPSLFTPAEPAFARALTPAARTT